MLLVLGLALLVGGGYVAAVLVAGDKIPRGTTVSGVDIGGLPRARAAADLAQRLEDRADAPLQIRVGGLTRSVRPEQAGLSVDYEASVAAGGGVRAWDPGQLWSYYTDGGDLDPVVAVDGRRLRSLVRRLDTDVAAKPHDGRIDFGSGRAQVTEPVVGARIDPGVAREVLVAAYTERVGASSGAADVGVVALTLRSVQPDIDASDIRAALDHFANPALAGPVTLVFGRSSVRLQPREFTPALRLRAEDGALVPDLRTEVLSVLFDSAAFAGEVAPADAGVRLAAGHPAVQPGRPGARYAERDITRSMLRALTRPDGRREVTVPTTSVRPGFTSRQARALRIREQVADFTTYLPVSESSDLTRAAELVDGSVLRPGETFSLATLVDLTGGDLSPLATAVFNAAFLAGLEDVEHQAHPIYLQRYPVGRDATVALGSADLSFRDDSPYGVLVSVSLTPDSVTVGIWSTKRWDVTTSTSERYDVVPPATSIVRTPGCLPRTGSPGFGVDVGRDFRRPGRARLDHRDGFSTSYAALDAVVCQRSRR